MTQSKVTKSLANVMVCVCIVGTSGTAAAISSESAGIVGECVWPNVVQVSSGQHCTGVVLAEDGNGDQFIITAAHCIDYSSYSNVQTGELNASITFGEDNGGFSATVDLIECHFNSATAIDDSYPNAPMFDGAGVEMVVCQIDPLGDYPDVPTVPIMSPEGAVRDELRWQMYYVHNSPPWAHKMGSSYGYEGPDITIVGTGAYNFSQNSYGPKRALNVMLTYQYNGVDDDFSSTTLVTNEEQNNLIGEIPGYGIAQGDSGAPEFYQAPDGTWRMTSVHHTSWGLRTYEEAVPTRLVWVESFAGDQTPCHEPDSDGWHWVYACEAEYPENMHTGTGTWDEDCQDDLETGGPGGWGEQWGPVPGYGKKMPAEPGNGLWVDKDVLAAAYTDIMTLANQGTYGTPPTESAIADAFYDVGAPLAASAFLEQMVDTGNDAVYLDRVLSGDFDGDSTMDTLIVQPMHDCRKGRVVQVIDDVQTVWDRDVTGVLGDSSCSDFFGASAAVGDFDNDGFDDVAIGAPGDAISSYAHAGSISVLYGSATGLTTSGDQMLHQDSAGVSGSSERWDFLGESLTVGDFDCDGYDDIAIGAPQEDVGATLDAGAVNVIYGSAGGLSTVADNWYQGATGVLDTDELGDRFGASIAAGNFNDDTNSTNSKDCDDLAIGSPGEDLGTQPDAGHVTVLYGGTSGLTTSAQQGFYQSSGLADTYESGDLVGSALAVVDLDANGIDDLVVQAGGEQCGSSTAASYGHQTLLGSGTGLSGSSTSLVCEDVEGAYTTIDRGHLRQLAEHYARAVIYQYENPI